MGAKKRKKKKKQILKKRPSVETVLYTTYNFKMSFKTQAFHWKYFHVHISLYVKFISFLFIIFFISCPLTPPILTTAMLHWIWAT